MIIHLNKNKRSEIRSIYEKIKRSNIIDLIDQFVSDFAFLSVCILCYDSYVYLLHQIDNYDWIEIPYVSECCQRLIDFKNSFKNNLINCNQSETKINKSFSMICQHKEQIEVELFIYGRIDDLIDQSVIEYKISNNFGDHMHIAQLMIYLWIMKKSSGYLYYPNLDKIIKIDISNINLYDQYTVNWFNKLTIEYYQLALKIKCESMPNKIINKPKIKPKNICLL